MSENDHTLKICILICLTLATVGVKEWSHVEVLHRLMITPFISWPVTGNMTTEQVQVQNFHGIFINYSCPLSTCLTLASWYDRRRWIWQKDLRIWLRKNYDSFAIMDFEVIEFGKHPFPRRHIWRLAGPEIEGFFSIMTSKATSEARAKSEPRINPNEHDSLTPHHTVVYCIPVASSDFLAILFQCDFNLRTINKVKNHARHYK